MSDAATLALVNTIIDQWEDGDLTDKLAVSLIAAATDTEGVQE